ncbi:MAG: hypothetical protein AAB360_01665 [Patescibacteria group bacterium]
MSYGQYLATKLKKIVGASVLLSLLSLAVWPALSSRADTPRFNGLVGDHELFTGRNISAVPPQVVPRDPVVGTVGDEFLGVIYYHNIIEGTVARNTTITVAAPKQTTNKVAFFEAAISADNAETVTDTILPDGTVVGRPGLTVALNANADIGLDLNSVNWFPNSTDLGSTNPQPIIVAPTLDGFSANIGDINGCWDFAGFITFKFRAMPQAINLDLNKTVRNIAPVKAETNFSELTAALFGEVVEFDVAATNPGSAPVDNILLSDLLPPELQYVPGTLAHIAGTTVTPLPDDPNAGQFFWGGWPMGHPLNPGETHSLRFQAKVVANVSAPTIVTNTAQLIAGAITLTDTAQVKILPAAANVEQHKRAVNLTSGEQAAPRDGNVSTATAKAGDEIEYALITKNNGVAPLEYQVEDNIADILEYANVVSVSDGGTVAGGAVKYPTVTLDPGATIERKFTVKVKDPLPANPARGFSFDDKLYNKYGDEILITLVRPAKKVELALDKTVRNVTASQSDFAKENEAFPGDILEYKIDFSNRGNAFADLVKFVDTLPPNVQYLEGTTVLSIAGGAEKTIINGITGVGFKLDMIGPDESGYIKFRAVLAPTLAPDEVLVNTVTLTFDKITLTSIAKTKVKAALAPPAPPTPVLPPSGAAAGASFLATMMAGIAGTYVKYRRLISGQLEVLGAANDILGM